jgi:hypothetical protein
LPRELWPRTMIANDSEANGQLQRVAADDKSWAS